MRLAALMLATTCRRFCECLRCTEKVLHLQYINNTFASAKHSIRAVDALQALPLQRCNKDYHTYFRECISDIYYRIMINRS